MKNSNRTMTENCYQPPLAKLWQGRQTRPELGPQYWYQAIACCDLESLAARSIAGGPRPVGLLGYACDEGVRRNQGRPGACLGPVAVRQRLARLAFHHEEKQLLDLGNVVCQDGQMEASQERLAATVAAILRHQVFPIVIGGGHDIAYGHFEGIRRALVPNRQRRLGIINFDAHFDLRPVVEQPNSGTPFNQILGQHGEAVQYLVIGIQPASNTRELFDIANNHSVEYILSSECQLSNLSAIHERLTQFLSQVEQVYVSIDLDVFSAAYAPGVSAPSPLGFRPDLFLQTLQMVMESRKVIACDLAELNPAFDRDQVTADLAARIVDAVVAMI